MGYPRVSLREEVMREGMQIESKDISVEQKTELLTMIAKCGLDAVNVGSFVSPKYTPQMANVEEVLRAFTPVPGPEYYALVFNQRGRDRAAEFDWIEDAPRFATLAHLCDTFVRRNINRPQSEEIASWGPTIERAAKEGATEAGIGVGAAWGSNFSGAFTTEQRMEMLRRQHALWTEAGIPVTTITFLDPMGWCAPHWVKETFEATRAEWPEIRNYHQHLHNARGLAIASVYESISALDEDCAISFDTTAGGIGGCPYCGTGRLTGMAATEDVVNLLDAMGVDHNVDLDALIEFVVKLDEVLGYRTPGHVSHAGPMPFDESDFYDPNLPLVETYEEVQHFRLGPSVAEHQIRPWKEPIPGPRS